jgi:hypothetical protein
MAEKDSSHLRIPVETIQREVSYEYFSQDQEVPGQAGRGILIPRQCEWFTEAVNRSAPLDHLLQP